MYKNKLCLINITVYNWVEVKFKMWNMNLGTAINVPKLNDAMAIELGANLLGEIVIFVIASTLLIAEYVRFVKFFYKFITSNCLLIILSEPLLKKRKKRKF